MSNNVDTFVLGMITGSIVTCITLLLMKWFNL